MAQAIQSTHVAAKQWLEEGFSHGYAKAYVDAGCFDVLRTVELRQAGITPLDIARSGLAWDYCSGTISLKELLRLFSPSTPGRETELPWGQALALDTDGERVRSTQRWLQSVGSRRNTQTQGRPKGVVTFRGSKE